MESAFATAAFWLFLAILATIAFTPKHLLPAPVPAENGDGLAEE